VLSACCACATIGGKPNAALGAFFALAGRALGFRILFSQNFHKFIMGWQFLPWIISVFVDIPRISPSLLKKRLGVHPNVQNINRL
jgi:hypothetical protein